jgi:hypothetical protein
VVDGVQYIYIVGRLGDVISSLIYHVSISCVMQLVDWSKMWLFHGGGVILICCIL